MRHFLLAPFTTNRSPPGVLLLYATICSAALSTTTIAAHAGICEAIVAEFNTAIDSGRDEAAEAHIEALRRDAACSGYVIATQRRLAAHRLAAAQRELGDEPPSAAVVRRVEAADRPGVLWQAAATIAEIRFEQRRFHEAAQKFDEAIEIVKNETSTPKAPSPAEIEGLLERAARARLLAANAPGGSTAAGFVATIAQARDGTLGGIYSAKVRGITPRVVPTPITFDYRSAVLTPQGEQAARELARAIREQRPERVILVGHTDIRGTADYNKKLSVARAEAVASFLRENDVEVPVAAQGLGAEEPLRLEPSRGLTEDDIHALNRRVEWRRDR